MEPNHLVDLVNVGPRHSGRRPRLPRSGEHEVSTELRRDPRVPIQEMVLGLPGGPRLATGNVSVGGVGFELDEDVELSPGDRFTVRLSVPDSHDPIDVSAELCHLRFVESAGLFYGGGRFVDLDELSEYPLFRYVEEASLLLLANTAMQ